jgi:hypothetical protein
MGLKELTILYDSLRYSLSPFEKVLLLKIHRSYILSVCCRNKVFKLVQLQIRNNLMGEFAQAISKELLVILYSIAKHLIMTGSP